MTFDPVCAAQREAATEVDPGTVTRRENKRSIKTCVRFQTRMSLVLPYGRAGTLHQNSTGDSPAGPVRKYFGGKPRDPVHPDHLGNPLHGPSDR